MILFPTAPIAIFHPWLQLVAVLVDALTISEGMVALVAVLVLAETPLRVVLQRRGRETLEETVLALQVTSVAGPVVVVPVRREKMLALTLILVAMAETEFSLLLLVLQHITPVVAVVV